MTVEVEEAAVSDQERAQPPAPKIDRVKIVGGEPTLTGDVHIEVDGKPWVMKNSWRAIAEIEDLTRRSVSDIVAELTMGSVGLKVVQAVLGASLRAGGAAADHNMVGEQIMKQGILSWRECCLAYLLAAIVPPDEARALGKRTATEGEKASQSVATSDLQ